ncbi:Carbohydrate sulfotransferase 5 [Dissostichus eleginoides]|uniref:Carbohydrate sulfotransferase 5 n=1 Tax=Dissostichus eleginoides TaxID=100907 RepID=A0AAD9B9I1_DISEL|nr:Carbohydrate sulfotransferase 5 [Dissostichus eleginoides]
MNHFLSPGLEVRSMEAWMLDTMSCSWRRCCSIRPGSGRPPSFILTKPAPCAPALGSETNLELLVSRWSSGQHHCCAAA